MNNSELNDLLKSLRTQKFRNKTQNQIDGIENRSADPEWHKANTQRYKNPDYAKNVGESIAKTYSSEEMRQLQAKKASFARSEETKKRIRDARLVAPPRSADTRKKIGDKQVGNQKRAKPIVTPYGIFASRKIAAENAPYGNATKHIEKYLKTNPTEYYYITKEEYEQLKGK